MYHKRLPDHENNELQSINPNYEIIYPSVDNLSFTNSVSLLKNEPMDITTSNALPSLTVSDTLPSLNVNDDSLDIDNFLDNLISTFSYDTINVDMHSENVKDKSSHLKENIELCTKDQQIDFDFLNSPTRSTEQLSESGYGSDAGDSNSSKCPSPTLDMQNDWEWMDSYTNLFPTLLEC